MRASEYYIRHEQLLQEVLDGMIEAADLAPDDDPAAVFATLVATLSRDPERAVTVAALAVMRLGEIRLAGGVA